MTIKVTNCHDCPFLNNDNEYGSSCNYPGNVVEDEEITRYNETDLPIKCPLRNGDVLVTLSK